MLEVLREFGGISFIFDLKEGEVFLGAIADLKNGKNFEIVANDRGAAGPCAIRLWRVWVMDLEIKNTGQRSFCLRSRVNMLGINWKSCDPEEDFQLLSSCN